MLFGEDRQPERNYVLIPRVSSERRQYVPFSFFGAENIAGDTCIIVADATLYNFGVLQSLMHMSWMRQVCGRLKSDYRYSNELVYNNFPWPESPDKAIVKEIELKAQSVLDSRKEFPNATLADLYNPETMPKQLLKSHEELNRAVDRAYGMRSFDNELKRLEFLFSLYQKYISEDLQNSQAKNVKK